MPASSHSPAGRSYSLLKNTLLAAGLAALLAGCAVVEPYPTYADYPGGPYYYPAPYYAPYAYPAPVVAGPPVGFFFGYVHGGGRHYNRGHFHHH